MNPFRPVDDCHQRINLTTGKNGKGIAKRYLEKKGYKILEKNYKTK